MPWTSRKLKTVWESSREFFSHLLALRFTGCLDKLWKTCPGPAHHDTTNIGSLTQAPHTFRVRAPRLHVPQTFYRSLINIAARFTSKYCLLYGPQSWSPRTSVHCKKPCWLGICKNFAGMWRLGARTLNVRGLWWLWRGTLLPPANLWTVVGRWARWCRTWKSSTFHVVSGYVCKRNEVLPSGCCDTSIETTSRYVCTTCLANHCCEVYEHCISCCLDPEKVRERLLESNSERKFWLECLVYRS